MDNLKPFDPDDIDKSLTRVIPHGRSTYLLFPYINAIHTTPRFESLSCVIAGPAPTAQDFAALSTLARKTADQAGWCISFNTPCLISPAEAEGLGHRRSARSARRP